MRRLLITFSLAFGLLSCDRTETNAADITTQTDAVPVVPSISLAGQLYFYAPELDTVSCEATGACDCCSGQILFLNDSDFVSIDYCESDATYNKGKYRFVKSNLVLATDSICVSRNYNWENETDTTGKDIVDYFISDTLYSMHTQILKQIVCKGTICFIMGDKEKYFVAPDEDEKLSEAVATLKEQQIWDRLFIKNYR